MDELNDELLLIVPSRTNEVERLRYLKLVKGDY